MLNSTIDAACMVLPDCAGIYTGARDRLPLNLTIEGNAVSNIGGTESVGIYLDDYANGVTVSGNRIDGSTMGMLIHNGFNNVLIDNRISNSARVHLVLSQDTAASIRHNRIVGNRFISGGNELTYSLEGAEGLNQFASWSGNAYAGGKPDRFARMWQGTLSGVTQSQAGWHSWSGEDAPTQSRTRKFSRRR